MSKRKRVPEVATEAPAESPTVIPPEPDAGPILPSLAWEALPEVNPVPPEPPKPYTPTAYCVCQVIGRLGFVRFTDDWSKFQQEADAGTVVIIDLITRNTYYNGVWAYSG